MPGCQEFSSMPGTRHSAIVCLRDAGVGLVASSYREWNSRFELSAVNHHSYSAIRVESKFKSESMSESESRVHRRTSNTSVSPS